MKWVIAVASAMTCLVVCTHAALAQQTSALAYPSKPIRLIVPLAAGGPSDFMARTLAQKLTEGVKQTVIVDNRPGASGVIGAELVAKSAPDGYTLLLSQTAVAVNASLFPKLPYDTLRDLEAVSQLTSAPYILAVLPLLPARNVQQLITLAKSRPGELNHSSGGSATGPHLAMELLMQRTGMRVQHIVYKGGGPAMIDFVAGHTQLFMTNIVIMLPQMRAGKVRALGISSAKRSPVAPDVATISESGVTGFKEGASQGVMAPAGIPRPIMEKLSGEVVKAMRSPDTVARLNQEGAEVVASSQDEYAAFLRADIEKWAKVIKLAGIRAE
jgi:tripartite-type tricarboxylate transporter receptor subunit TctC